MLLNALAPVLSALDAATQKHQIIASNIANARTEGYVSLRATLVPTFAAAFESAGGNGMAAASSSNALSALAVRLDVQPDVDAQGQARPVQIDEQMAALSENTLHYSVLAKATARHMSVLNMAVSDGKK